ncbi:hypothetical protein [Scleromatobacter humisilvae]|uniref:Uncharacterized protein n=1 Tax=Scleromatobacter humisilvae TaxID=2897159 RepID=A0A9X2BXX5_9BURK|nr:hypothetical protein [Scleromatobacter humisilvae]MCK9685053.1 hypothetical protein [Scleromatobacter humisilvae]
MRPAFRILAACLSAAIALPAAASQASDAAASCLVDHTNGRDRKDLARWFVIAMSAHPEIRTMMTISPPVHEEADRKTAALFTRLIAVDCTVEMKAAMQADGQLAFKVAFGKLGEVAVQELMSDPGVTASLGAIDKYMDSARIRDALAH